jgi:hypothetical protein
LQKAAEVIRCGLRSLDGSIHTSEMTARRLFVIRNIRTLRRIKMKNKSLVRRIVRGTSLLAIIFDIGLASAQADVIWTDWTSITVGDPGSAVGTLGGANVSFSGQADGHSTAIAGGSFWTFPQYDVLGGQDPGNLGLIGVLGNTNLVQTITFSAPVVNPLMAIESLGNANLPVTLNFGDETFQVLTDGAGVFGNGSSIPGIGESGTALIGREFNGVILFQGTFSKIDWTIQSGENYHVFTIGSAGTVPVPASLPLLGSALAGLALRLRRRQ